MSCDICADYEKWISVAREAGLDGLARLLQVEHRRHVDSVADASWDDDYDFAERCAVLRERITTEDQR